MANHAIIVAPITVVAHGVNNAAALPVPSFCVSVPGPNPKPDGRRPGASAASVQQLKQLEPSANIREFLEERLRLTRVQAEEIITSGYTEFDDLAFMTEDIAADLRIIRPGKATIKNYAIWVQDASDSGMSGVDLTRVNRNIVRSYVSQLTKEKVPTEVGSHHSSINVGLDASGMNIAAEWEEREKEES